MRILLRIISLTAMLALLLGCLPALAVQADTVTRQCTFEVSRGREKYLTDGDIETAWEPSGENARLLITLPANGAGYVHIEWQEEPAGYVLAQYDADKNEIASSDGDAEYTGITQMYELREDARYVLITLTDEDQAICEVTVYSAGDLPAGVQRWYPAYTKCDLMLVAAYPGDELVTFGGLLPYYALERGANVQLVYMTGASRVRRSETLDAMWSIGIRNYPEFMGLKSSDTDSLEECLSLWGGRDRLVGAMVETIRKCKPEVIVSHDINGEGGDHKRILTAMLMQYAIDAAADPDEYPESAEEYGAWQVKKLYLHMGAESVIDFDWTAVGTELGVTPIAAAQAAFESYSTLSGRYSVSEDGEYDSSIYGLEYSFIGADTRHDDIFENIAALEIAAPEAEAAETTSTPAPTPSPTPALVFSPEPTATQRAQTGTADGFGSSMVSALKFVGIGLGIILLLTCCQAAIYHFRRRGRRRR